MTGRRTEAMVAGVVGVVVVTLVVASGMREVRRQQLVAQFLAAVLPHLGLRAPAPDTVRVRRWARRGDGGHPVVVQIRYGSGAVDTVDWTTRIADIATRRLGGRYEVASFDQQRCRLELRVAPAPPSAHPVVERADRVVRGIFGEGASVNLELDPAEEEVVAIAIRHALGPKVARQHARSFIENSITALLPGRWRARWSLTEDTVRFELRPTMPTAVPRVPAKITPANLMRIPLGVDEDGNEIFWNMSGSGPHLIVCGKTGTGKTVAINGVVMETARRDWRVWVCDPKRIEFMGLRQWPNVQIVATDVVDQVAVIYAAHELMEQRYAEIEDGTADESDFEPVVLVLDEFRNFHRLVTAWYTGVKVKGMPTKCPVFDWVAAIAEKGRSGRVHLVLGTQRPDAEFMTGSMRDNFDSRLSLGRLSPQGAQMMWESPYLGVSVPRSIRGRGTGITEDERVTEMQVLWTPDPRRAARDENAADLALLERLRPTAAIHPALEVQLGDDQDLDGGTLGEWQQVLDSRLVPTGTTSRPAGGPPLAALLRGRTGAHPAVETAEPADVDVDDVGSSDYVQGDGADDLFEGYSPARSVAAGRVQVGDLVLVDEQVDHWAVLEAADLDDGEDSMCLAWRSDDGEAGDLVIDDSHVLSVRRPLGEPDED
ncbi:FtsK/SpoIIIE domain-containing protein [uncultured Cellulomonas sp.]|uniref:FtsK/SpoIIIE domain-containing protein n=1 Tax=uncultured Cellulomonas sp. TaxID=189682 RepID=UPI0026021780|nr:FtsK/SpoIIIE domain-containing protein [uncultured Cellulomonas sp.]